VPLLKRRARLLSLSLPLFFTKKRINVCECARDLSLSLSLQTRLIRWFIYSLSLSLSLREQRIRVTKICAREFFVSIRSFVREKDSSKVCFRVSKFACWCKGGHFLKSLSLFSFLCCYCLLRGGRSGGFRGRDVIAVRFLFKLSRSPVRVDAEERD
jgi:hypothetical protein